MLQPIRTLRDNPNVFELPNDRQEKHRKKKESIVTDPEDPVLRLQKASDNLKTAQQGQKYENLNDFLLEEPEKPELDEQAIEKNRKLSRKAAAIQLIDSLSGLSELNRNQENAAVAPVRMDQIGLSALNNLQNLDEQHRIDLNRYNQQSDQVDRANKQLEMQMQQHNQGVDIQTAQQEYEQARHQYDQMLDEEERAEIRADEEKERYYEAGLRLITQGKFDMARAQFQQAGMKPEAINTMVDEAEDSESLVGPKERKMYEEYLHYSDKVSDDQYKKGVDEFGNEYIDYDSPRKGTPAWYRDDLIDKMGEDFYVIDHELRPGREAAQEQQAQNQIQQSSQELQSSPRIQKMRRDANITAQKQLADNILKAPDLQTAQQAAGSWMDIAQQMLLEDGVPEDQVDQLTEQMFVAMMDDLRSGGQQQQEQSDEPSQESNYAQTIGGSSDDEGSRAPSQEQIEAERENMEGAETEPNRRESLPRHLRQAYDVGDKFLEQKQRMDQIREVNPNFDTTIGDREEERLRKQLIEQLDRIPDDQRQAVIEALGYNPYEEEQE